MTYGNTPEMIERVAAHLNCSPLIAGLVATPYFTQKKPIYDICTRQLIGYTLSNVRLSNTNRFVVFLSE